MDRLGFAAAAAPSFTGARLRAPARCASAGPRMALSRRDALGAAVGAAAALLAGSPALAKGGDAPKISVFGVGGASSPFTKGVQKGGTVQYEAFGDDEVEVFKKCVEVSKDRLAGTVAIVKEKSWDDVRSQVRLEMYELRKTAERLNANVGDKGTKQKAAQEYADFKNAIEKLDYAAITKNQDKAYKSLSKATASLNSWASTVGI